jgi:hypothetical protein
MLGYKIELSHLVMSHMNKHHKRKYQDNLIDLLKQHKVMHIGLPDGHHGYQMSEVFSFHPAYMDSGYSIKSVTKVRAYKLQA